jgi:membrane protein
METLPVHPALYFQYLRIRVRNTLYPGLRFLKNLFRDILMQDNLPMLAGSISFFSLLSIVPVLLVFASLAGFLLSSETVYTRVTDLAARLLPATVSDESVIRFLNNLQAKKKLVGLFGLLGLIWTAARTFGSIEAALNYIWKIPSGRPYWHSLLLRLSLVPAFAVFILLSLALTAVYASFRSVPLPLIGKKITEFPFLTKLSATLLPIFIAFLLFFLIYKIMPRVKVSNLAAGVGALFGAVAWELAKLLFDLFAKTFAGPERFYGSAATIALFFVWVYYSCYILLLGGEVGKQFQLIWEEAKAARRVQKALHKVNLARRP